MTPRLAQVVLACTVAVLWALRLPAQTCPEPSALDLTPGVAPLRVAKAPGGLALTWEDLGSGSYRVHRGHLDVLFYEHRYDHLPILTTTRADATFSPVPIRNRTFLVNQACRTEDGSVGRDSFGRERPHGGLSRLTMGVAGPSPVFAVQVDVVFLPDRIFTDPDRLAFIGPFAPGATGSPFGLAFDPLPDRIRFSVFFSVTSPDPSFTPGPGTSIAELDVAADGPPPALADFTLEGCSVVDIGGNLSPGDTCELVDVRVLF